eukprot:10814576-Alexandrium_andersonii.AAC.1
MPFFSEPPAGVMRAGCAPGSACCARARLETPVLGARGAGVCLGCVLTLFGQRLKHNDESITALQA